MKKPSPTGTAMRARRLKAGISLADIARRIINPMTGNPVSWGSCYRWERDEIQPHPMLREAWERVLAQAEKDNR